MTGPRSVAAGPVGSAPSRVAARPLALTAPTAPEALTGGDRAATAPTAPGLHVGLPRSGPLTAALLGGGGPAADPRRLDEVRALVERRVLPIAGRLREGGEVRIDAYRLTAVPAGAEPGGGDRFVHSPRTCRRAIGSAAVERCLRGEAPGPAAAVDEVVAAGIAEAEHPGPGAGAPWWGSWVASLSPPAQAVVRAEALAWATDVWSALDWDRIGTRVTVGPRPARWHVQGRGRVSFEGRGDVTVWSAGRPALLVVAGGVASGAWRTGLAWPALVAALAYGERALPSRVVGLWPASGQVRILPVDGPALVEAAEAGVAAAARWAR